MKDKLRLEPAFPSVVSLVDEKDGTTVNNIEFLGMSKRLYIATMAMQGYLSNPHIVTVSPKRIIEDCYQMADELLKQENI